MKTKKTKTYRINILFSFIAVMLMPFIGSAQLKVSSSGGVSVNGTTAPGTGLLVEAGDINLNSASNAFKIGGNKMLWHNNNINNIFVGYNAGNSISSGVDNTLVGSRAGELITTSFYNTAFGSSALKSLTTSTGYNSAFGRHALYYNTGSYNCAVGGISLYNNTTGRYSVGVGYRALYNNTTGEANVGVGYLSGNSITTGHMNTFIGYGANANAGNYSNATAIGNGAIITVSNSVVIGNTSVTSIGGYAANYTNLSDVRFKTNIKEEVKGLEFITKLRPVNYNINTQGLDDFIMKNMPDSIKQLYSQGRDYTESSGIVHTGFIAQEVEEAAALCNYMFDGLHKPANETDPYGLAYSQFVVPLVKAVQEQQVVIDGLTAQVTTLQTQLSSCCSIIDMGMKTTHSETGTAAKIAEGKQSLGIENEKGVTLFQNTPNPFDKETSIEYAVPATSQSADIMIFDMQGKLIKTARIKNFGKGAVTISKHELNSGMYLYSLIVDGKIIDTKRMILTE